MSHSHQVTRCRICNKIIRQCRCTTPPTITTYVICGECRDKPVPDVTLETMKHVDIKPGWLIEQFALHVLGYAHEALVSYRSRIPPIEIIQGRVSSDLLESIKTYDALVVQKNQQYKDAWQKDGPVTALVDLKDKLYRLESANESGAMLAWEKDKLIGTLFDILVRDIMCLAWFGLNFKDDDDDRRSDGEPDYSERHV